MAVLCCVAVLTTMAGCEKKATNKDSREVQKDIYAMDTVMNVKAYGKNAEKAVTEAE